MDSIKNLDKSSIYKILENAEKLKLNFLKNNLIENELKKIYENKIFGLLFFEPSTRTCLSFESAINRLGGKIIKYNSNYSSEKKGESLEDTIRTISYYVDILIIRHPEKNIISIIKKYTNKPIINAGDGSGEHPTQSLLDLFTIYTNKYTNFSNICFTGDIRYSRTIHSLVYLMSKLHIFKNTIFHFVSDDKLKPDNDFLEFLNNMNNEYYCYNSLNNIIKKIDVLYVTRIQKERSTNNENIKNIIINKETVKDSKKNLIILHPLPRNEELSTDLDDDNRSKYFDQVENGVFIRMAIINLIFNVI